MADPKKAHERDTIELLEDVPSHNLKRGDRGAIVEVFDAPEEAYMVEFVDESGNSSVILDWVKPDQVRNIGMEARLAGEKGFEYVVNEDLVNAERNFEIAVHLDPGSIRIILRSVMNLISSTQNWGLAVAALRMIIRLDPDYEIARKNMTVAYINLGVAEGERNNYEAACDAFIMALATASDEETKDLIRTNLAAAHIRQALIAFGTGDIERTVYFMALGFQANPNHITKTNLAKASLQFGMRSVDQGKFQTAIVYLTRAVDLGLVSPAILNEIAVAFVSLGLVNEARMYLKQGLSLDPDSEIIKSNLSKLEPKASVPLQEMRPEELAFLAIPLAAVSTSSPAWI